MPPHERKRRRRRIVLVSGLVLALFVSAAAAYVVTRQAGRRLQPGRRVPRRAVRHARAGGRARRAGPKREDATRSTGFIWPIYGYTRDRRRYLPLKDPPHPPFDEVWRFSGNVLLEFPPVIGGKRLYLLNDHGEAVQHRQAHRRRALEPQARRARRRLARLRRRQGLRRAAAARRDRRRRQGRARRRARRQDRQGRVEQQAREPQRVLAARRRRPALLRRRERHGLRDGRARRAARAGGSGPAAPSRAGVALADGKLYFGAYGGHVYAIRQSDGRQVWESSSTVGRVRDRRPATSTRRPRSPTAASTSATPNGSVYSYSAASGKLAWSHGTGGYVYASPAVAQVPGGRPTGLRRLLQRPLLRARRALGQRASGRAAATARSPAARR